MKGKIHFKNTAIFNIKELSWEKAKPRIMQANPYLGAILEELKPTKDHKFVLACYPFGVNILDQGQAFFPADDGYLMPITDTKIPASIRDLLSYSMTPLALILSKSVEIYVETSEHRTVPFKVFHPGTSFGVWEIMDFPKVTPRQNWYWNASSGARTVFLLPSISETVSHARLQVKYKIKSYIPDNFFDHHKIFRELIYANNSEWGTEILFFSKKWLELDEKNIGWVKLKNYWMQMAWHQIQYWSNRVTLNLNWEKYIAELNTRKIKLHPYLLDTMKQLVSIATGTITGFRPIDESEVDNIIPKKIIENAYLKEYKLKKYFPVIMQPDFLFPNSETKTIYYSLQYPTLPEKPVDIKIFPSMLKMMRQLKLLVDVFMEMMDQFPPVTQAGLYDFSQHIKIDFFHSEADKHGVIKPASQLIKEDPVLSKLNKKMRNRVVPDNCHFFKGCVRISFID